MYETCKEIIFIEKNGSIGPVTMNWCEEGKINQFLDAKLTQRQSIYELSPRLVTKKRQILKIDNKFKKRQTIYMC